MTLQPGAQLILIHLSDLLLAPNSIALGARRPPRLIRARPPRSENCIRHPSGDHLRRQDRKREGYDTDQKGRDHTDRRDEIDKEDDE